MKKYFLFMNETILNFQDAMEMIRCGSSYDTYVWGEGNNDPVDLICAYSYWNDYIILSEEEYNAILEL